MVQGYFAAAWERWDRANEHRVSLASIWNDFIDTHPFDFALNPTGDGALVLQVWQESPTPPRFAVVMGEWLYNIRSALDYTLWATAVHDSGQDPPPCEDVMQFPIYDTEKSWKRNEYRLKVLLPKHREMLHAQQPFHGDVDANYLGWINRLARIDRHRRLVDGTARIAELQPVLAFPPDREVSVFWGERVLTAGSADVLLVRPKVEGELGDLRVNPRAGLDPEVAEWASSSFWGAMPFSKRLSLIQTFVASEIAVYEFDCTGASRKSDLLTEDFRRDSDTSRAPIPITVTPKPPTSWRPAGAGRPVTDLSLLGGDFPPHGPGQREPRD